MKSKLKLFFILWSLFWAMSGVGQALTVAEEKELGDKYLDQMLKHLDIVKDPVINRMVNKIGSNILEAAGPQPFNFKFFVAKEDVYNAFAGPGGFIVVHSGLLGALENENQLAGIIAHEIAHVSCRHISERIQKNSKVQMASIAGMVAGLLIGSPVGGALTVGSAAAGQSAVLAYSREDETQADQIGIKYLLDAGYGGDGLINSLKIMRQKTWFGPDQVPSYLMTHPASEERIVYLGTWLEANPMYARPKRRIDPYEYGKVRVRINALYSDADISIDKLKAAVESRPGDPLTHYGYGLCLSRVNQREMALEQIKKALSLSPFDSDIMRDLGRVEFEAGHYDKAISSLMSALEADPGAAEGFFWLGRARMETNDLKGALSDLESAHELAPEDASVNYYLGQVCGQRGLLARAHYHLGIHHQILGDLLTSGFHLKKALESVRNDPDLRSNIEKALEKAEKNSGKHSRSLK